MSLSNSGERTLEGALFDTGLGLVIDRQERVVLRLVATATGRVVGARANGGLAVFGQMLFGFGVALGAVHAGMFAVGVKLLDVLMAGIAGDGIGRG